jgi:hypothetical protein
MVLRERGNWRWCVDAVLVLAAVFVVVLFFAPFAGTPAAHANCAADPTMCDSPPPPPPPVEPPPPPPPPPPGGDATPPAQQPGNFTPSLPAAKPHPKPGPPPGDFANNLPPAEQPTAAVTANPLDPATPTGPVDPKLVDNSTPKDNGPNSAGEAAGGVLVAVAIGAAAIGTKPKDNCDSAEAASLTAEGAAACAAFNEARAANAQASEAWNRANAELAALQAQWQQQRDAFNAIKDTYRARWWARYGAYGTLGAALGVVGGASVVGAAGAYKTALEVARYVFLGGGGAFGIVPGVRAPSIEEQSEAEVDAAIARELARVDAEFQPRIAAKQAEINGFAGDMFAASDRMETARGQFAAVEARWNPFCGALPACAGM